MKIRNLGKNKTEIVLNDSTSVLVSYETPVAACINGVYSKTAKQHSATTTKHINQWADNAYALEYPQSFFDELLTIGDTNNAN